MVGVTEGVIIAGMGAVTTILTGFMKYKATQEKRILLDEVRKNKAAIDAMVSNQKAQAVFNDNAARTVVRVEEKQDALIQMHNDPNSLFATKRVQSEVHEQFGILNIIARDVAVIKDRK